MLSILIIGETLKSLATFFLLSICISFFSVCFANTGVFYGSGNQVIPIKNDKIQLVREKVDIELTVDENSGRFGVPFIPWANVTAKFYLKNTTGELVSLQMGFPFLDLQGFGDEKFVLDNLNFKVLSDSKEIKSELKEGLIEKEFDPKGLFNKVFAWPAEFEPEESKEVIVTYRMLMGVASANSVFRSFDEQGRKFRSIDKLFPALSYSFGYITKTAYTWAGPVEEAIFTLNCTAFYKEVDRHNFKGVVGKNAPNFTRPTFWESIQPSSAKKHNGVYRWTFNGSVPKEGLSVNLTVLFLPSLPAEVGNYFSTALASLKSTTEEESTSVLHAYYQNIAFNKQPSTPFAKDYFKKVRLIKMPKVFISKQDKMNIKEIANNFEQLIAK